MELYLLVRKHIYCVGQIDRLLHLHFATPYQWEADKLSNHLAEAEQKLESMRVPNDPVSGAPLKQHPPSRPKLVEVKIAELNKKIRRAKNGRNERRLIAKRDALQAELN